VSFENRIYRLTIHRLRRTATEERFFVPLPEGIVISGLQIEATIERTLARQPNTCDIKIRNVAPATRAALQRDGVVITLDAGHDGVARRLFSGDLNRCYSQKDGTDWVTEIEATDGGRAFAFARVNRSFKSGATIIQVIREAASSMGLELSKEVLASEELKQQFAAGFALNGRTRDELTRLLAPFGYGWSIQDGRLQILRDDEARDDVAKLVGQDQGMIGSPIFGNGAKKGDPPRRSVKMLLYPELTPGGKVQVQSRQLEGLFRIQKVKHALDFEGQEWSTEIEVVQA